MAKRNDLNSSVLLEHLSSEVVTTTEGFEAIQKQWDALFEAASDVTVFQSFSWNYAWWKAFGESYNLFILVIYEKDNLVGLAPFVTKRRLGVPEIEPIGKDQYAYFGLLAEDSREDVIEALAQRLCDSFPVGLVHFPYYTLSNHTVNVLGGALSARGWRETRWRRQTSRTGSMRIMVSKVICAANLRKPAITSGASVESWKEQNRVTVARYLGPEVDECVVQRVADIQKRSWLSKTV